MYVCMYVCLKVNGLVWSETPGGVGDVMQAAQLTLTLRLVVVLPSLGSARSGMMRPHSTLHTPHSTPCRHTSTRLCPLCLSRQY